MAILEALTAQVIPCPIPYLPCGGGGAAGMSAYVTSKVPHAVGLFAAILFLYLFYYAVLMIVQSHDDNALTELKSAYGYALGGGLVVALGGLIVAAFSPYGTGPHFINAPAAASIFSSVLAYLRILVAVVAVGFVTVRGFRLVTSFGDESALSKQKKLLLHAIVGAGIALMADAIVGAFAERDSTVLGEEFRGIANFMLVVFGALAVVAIIGAGVILIFSFEESAKEKAKKVVVSSVVALIVVLTSLIIINLFLGL